MMSVMDYVQTVGDYSFSVVPYNEVDLMALLDVCYLPIEQRVPALEPGAQSEKLPAISLVDLARNFSLHKIDLFAKNHIMTTKYRSSLLAMMAKYPRYQEILFKQMYQEVDHKKVMEYASVVFQLPGVEEQIVAFRGSNDSIISWKENFQLVTLDTVPSHQVVLNYLNEVYQQCSGPYVLTGHSKGGNLALFGGYFMDYTDAPSSFIDVDHPISTDQMKKIYVFDGPGLSPKFTPELQQHPMLEKTVQYIPESAIVGSRYYSPVRPEIVASRSFSVLQHDMRYWEINKDTLHLQEAEQVTALSLVFNQTYEEWFAEFSKDDILAFYEVFFDLLLLMGYKSFADVDNDLLNFLSTFPQYYQALSDKAQELIDRVGYRFLEIARQNLETQSTLLNKIASTKASTLQMYLKYQEIKSAVEDALADRFLK